MARESYPLSTHLQANALYGGVGAVLGTIVWGLAFTEDTWWHGALGGAVIAPAAMYLTPFVAGFILNDDGPEN